MHNHNKSFPLHVARCGCHAVSEVRAHTAQAYHTQGEHAMSKVHRNGFTFAAALVALAIALASTGCATSRPYTGREKAALGFAVAGQAWDVGSTAYAVSKYDNLSEANPFWDDLNDQELMCSMLLTKAAILGGGYLLGEWKPDWRVRIYSIIGGVGATAGAANTYLITQQD
jgi:hypothetical protein